MKKLLVALLISLSMVTLASCSLDGLVGGGGGGELSPDGCKHTDTNFDGICDLCGESGEVSPEGCKHTDANFDGVCDLCGVDKNGEIVDGGNGNVGGGNSDKPGEGGGNEEAGGGDTDKPGEGGGNEEVGGGDTDKPGEGDGNEEVGGGDTDKPGEGGDTDKPITPPIEHECLFVFKGETIAPTCTDGGYTVYGCPLCGRWRMADPVDALGHTTVEVTIEDEENPGSYYEIECCTVCQREVSRTTVAAPSVDHECAFEELCTAFRTCTEGYTVYGCTECELGYIDDLVDVTAHIPSGEIIDVEQSSCTEGQYLKRPCGVCGELYVYDFLEPREHNICGVFKENEFESDGEIPSSYDVVVWCYNCGEVSRTTVTWVPDTDHECVFEAIYTLAPTCEVDGYTLYVCHGCGDHRKDDYVDALGHNMEFDDITPATCTQAGYTTYVCTNCGTCRFEDIPSDEAKGHTVETFVIKGVEADAENAGHYFKLSRCTECGSMDLPIEIVIVPPIGHNFVEQSVVSPLCEEWGYTVYACTDCDVTYTGDYVAPLGDHDYEATYECDHDWGEAECTVCCTVCGDTYTEIRYVFEERLEEVLVEPGCESNGLGVYVIYCIGCETEISRENREIYPTGHTISSWDYVCIYCGECFDPWA